MAKSSETTNVDYTNVCETKKKLFTIATMAYQMWEHMDENEKIDTNVRENIRECDGMITKIAKSYLLTGSLK